MIKSAAFSLVEVMVVILIIALLATFGHNEYVAYVARAQVAEAIEILQEYQNNANSLRVKSGNIAPYYVLFTSADTTGLVSGTPTGTSAVKTVSLKYVNTITADSGTSGSNTYILIGAGLNDQGDIVSGADHVYIAGVQTSSGVFTWSCGISASKGDTVPTSYLPQTCQSSLP